MNELLDNIFDLVKNHFDHKVKKVQYSDDSTEEKVNKIIDFTANRVYDFCMEILEDADKTIDNAIETMDFGTDYEAERREREKELERDFFNFNY